MATFTYKGEDKDGNKIVQTITAADRFAVYALARDQGHSVTSISEGSRISVEKFLNLERINYTLSRVKQDELVMVTRNLGSMLKAGLTVSRALSVIERQTRNPRLKGVTKRLVERINQGDQFNQALREFPETFDNLFVAMISAGEESGKLAETLGTLAIQMERAGNLKKKIKGAMIYPSIVLSIMLGIGVLMMTFVMPKITVVFKGMNKELPATTQFLINLSDFMAGNAILVVIGLVAAIIGIIFFFKSRIGRTILSWVVTRLPAIGEMAKETNAARTARTLSSLLNSGVDVVRSIEITEEVLQNVFYKKIIHEARGRVEQGKALSEIFIERSDLYPILVGEMILVGEETGQIAGMLGELAIYYEIEVERKTKDLSTIIEPLLMVVIGGGVGFFALALIAPIYSISDGLN